MLSAHYASHITHHDLYGMDTPDYKLITAPEELEQAVTVLREAAEVGFDTETTGLDPHTSRLRLIQLAAAIQCFSHSFEAVSEAVARLWILRQCAG